MESELQRKKVEKEASRKLAFGGKTGGCRTGVWGIYEKSWKYMNVIRE